MEKARLTSDRATIIHNSIVNDGTFVGTPEWLEEHHVTKEEFDTFLDYGERLSRMYEYREENMSMPPLIECKGVFTKGTIDAKAVRLTVEVSPSSLPAFQNYMNEDCIIQVFPEQMPLPLPEVEYVAVDGNGEIVE